LNTFDENDELGFFEEPRRRPPRERPRRRQRSGPRRTTPPSRPNTVLRLAGLVVIAIAIVFGLVFSCSADAKSGYVSYIDAMTPLAQDSASVGSKFATALGTPGLTMDAFESDLADWSKQEQADYVAAQRLQPPGPLQSAHAEALATFQLRAVGLVGLASTLTLAKSKSETPAAASAALASEAKLLTASDIVWEQLYKLPTTQVLKDHNVGDVIVPSSQIVTSPDIVSASSLSIAYQRVGTTRSGGSAGGHLDNALVSLDAVGSGATTRLSTSAGSTVAVGSSLVLEAVFQNGGSVPEVKVPVTLTIKAGAQNVFSHTQTVSLVAAGAQATASFTNIQVPPSAFGHSAVITVTIAKVRGEARLDNNSASYPVFFRLAPN